MQAIRMTLSCSPHTPLCLISQDHERNGDLDDAQEAEDFGSKVRKFLALRTRPDKTGPEKEETAHREAAYSIPWKAWGSRPGIGH